MIAEPKIVEIEARKLVGMRIKTSLAEDRTFELWRSFKPKVKTIANILNSDFYSVLKYGKDTRMAEFTPETLFDKWAAVEVEHFNALHDGLENLVISAGRYAVFNYKGTVAAFYPVAKYIYLSWIPDSGYDLDDREHFTVMGEKYLPNDPLSEEEIWIPVRDRMQAAVSQKSSMQ